MSLSVPFFTRSLQSGAAQRPAVQIVLVQSAPTTQTRPVAHGLHAPPQSTSVSFPFFTRSVQVWGTHLLA
jgi:hypothetical protein